MLTQTQHYDSKWPFYWLVYPLVYLPIIMIVSSQTGRYPYFFLDIGKLVVGGFAIWVAIMFGLFFVFGLLYTYINHLVFDDNPPTTVMD